MTMSFNGRKQKLTINKIRSMKKLTLLAILTVLTVGCVEVEDCYKCELISVDGRFSRTEYVPCDTDIEHYKEWLYDRGKVGVVKCTEL